MHKMESEKPNFDKMRKDELVDFLKGYPYAKISGLKPELLLRAKHYYETKGPPENKEENGIALNKLVEQRKIFSDKSLTWKDISELPAGSIQKELEDEAIGSFLTNYDFLFGEELIDCSTQKPGKKGKHLYLSEKIQMCEFSKTDSHLLFRCTMSASMKSTFR